MGVVVRRYIDFLILLIPTPLVSVLFCCCTQQHSSKQTLYTQLDFHQPILLIDNVDQDSSVTYDLVKLMATNSRLDYSDIHTYHGSEDDRRDTQTQRGDVDDSARDCRDKSQHQVAVWGGGGGGSGDGLNHLDL